MISKQSRVGFAIAIFELSKELKKEKKIYNEIKIIRDVLNENQEFISLIDNSSILFSQKEKIILETFHSMDEILINTMLLLTENNRFNFMIEISNLLISQLQNELNIKEGIVYSTFKLKETQLKKLEKKIGLKFGAKVSLKNYIDKELIGGFKIVIDDIIIEDSIKSDLKDLKNNLLNKGEF